MNIIFMKERVTMLLYLCICISNAYFFSTDGCLAKKMVDGIPCCAEYLHTVFRN